MKNYLLLLCLFSFSWTTVEDDRTKNFPKKTEYVIDRPAKEKTWVFLMAGQSNMAGRGIVEPQDTVSDKRIITIDARGSLIYAKEPLHFYEPTRAGLDCGLSFAKNLLKRIPADISILILPTAIGGSSMRQWLGDSSYRGVKLMTNFKEKAAIGKEFGQIKGILWHQGESDANNDRIPFYQSGLQELLSRFRTVVGNEHLPVLIGELGSYSNNKNGWAQINSIIHNYATTDKNVSVVSTADFIHVGDTVHFNSEGQRMMGTRFAGKWLADFNR